MLFFQLLLGAPPVLHWYSVKGGSASASCACKSTPAHNVTTFDDCTTSCLQQPRYTPCNGVNFADFKGEGANTCSLLNCTFPEHPEAYGNGGGVGEPSCAMHTATQPQPNPCGSITDASACNELAWCAWCDSWEPLVPKGRLGSERPRGQQGCDSWDPLVPKDQGTGCEKNLTCVGIGEVCDAGNVCCAGLYCEVGGSGRYYQCSR
jgi:hypothetical protein